MINIGIGWEIHLQVTMIELMIVLSNPIFFSSRKFVFFDIAILSVVHNFEIIHYLHI